MQTEPSILINGSAATDVSVTDRGLLYGDGVFETMVWEHRSIRYFDRHLARLTRGCLTLGLPVPETAVLESEIGLLTNSHEHCIIKAIITRGRSGWGYTPEVPCATPTRIVQRLPIPVPKPTGQGLHCAVLATNVGANRQLAGIKHLNRLEQVLAAKEVAARGLDEGILCSADGFVMEAVSSNLLIVFGARLVTPRLDTGGVHGVLREVLIDLLQIQGIEVHKDYVYVDTLAEADEIILCNSIRGIQAVSRLGDATLDQRKYFQLLTGLLSGNRT